MSIPPTVGFPIMREETSERRAFLPHFVQQLAKIGFEVFLEKDYGLTVDFQLEDYQAENPHIHSVDRSAAFKQDYVLILRSPHDEEFDLLAPHSCLLSMLHFPTRPLRVGLLKEKCIQAISLDSIVNDFNIRLVENMRAVAWNGLESVFAELQARFPHFIRQDGKSWQVLILGSGMVGKHAMDAATKFGRRAWNDEHIQAGGQGVLVRTIGRNLSAQKDRMLALLAESHILVDATQRSDPSQPVIPNDWLAACPPDLIIADLSVDPYTLASQPPVVKGIQGIPQGNLDKYIFDANDSQWDASVPSAIPSKNRRKTVSCYSWPGIYPKRCMHVYGQQMLPLLRVLFNKNYNSLSPQGTHFERALFRARIDSSIKCQNT